MQEEGVSRKFFTYQQVCTSFGVKNPIMADKKDAKTIDCMGREFKIAKFCEKKFSKNKTYTMARFDFAEKKIMCRFAQAVIVEVICDKKHKQYCDNGKKRCLELKKEFARNLTLSNDFILEMYPPKLRCLYSSTSKLDI